MAAALCDIYRVRPEYSGYISGAKSVMVVRPESTNPIFIFVSNGVIGRTDSVVVDVRVANSVSLSDNFADVCIVALPSLSVAIVSNVNNSSAWDAILAFASFVWIDRPPVVSTDTDAVALLSVMFVITVFIINESFGATTTGADVDMIYGEWTSVVVCALPTALSRAATANMLISPLKYSGISNSTVPVLFAAVFIIPE